MSEETDRAPLMFEILRKIQGDMACLRDDMRDVKAGQRDIRSVLATMQNDAVRQERALASVELRIERIENRLELRDH